MRGSIVFFLGLAFGSIGVAAVYYLNRKKKQAILHSTESVSKVVELEFKLNSYLKGQKEYRKNTRYRHEFNLDSFGGSLQPESKEFVTWLMKLSNIDQQEINRFISNRIDGKQFPPKAFWSIGDFYKLLRLLDAIADLELIVELESSNSVSSDWMKKTRVAFDIELNTMLRELELNE